LQVNHTTSENGEATFYVRNGKSKAVFTDSGQLLAPPNAICKVGSSSVGVDFYDFTGDRALVENEFHIDKRYLKIIEEVGAETIVHYDDEVNSNYINVDIDRRYNDDSIPSVFIFEYWHVLNDGTKSAVGRDILCKIVDDEHGGHFMLSYLKGRDTSFGYSIHATHQAIRFLDVKKLTIYRNLRPGELILIDTICVLKFTFKRKIGPAIHISLIT